MYCTCRRFQTRAQVRDNHHHQFAAGDRRRILHGFTNNEANLDKVLMVCIIYIIRIEPRSNLGGGEIKNEAESAWHVLDKKEKPITGKLPHIRHSYI